MANGDPLRAKEIYQQIDEEWFMRWSVWKTEKAKTKTPDLVVGMYGDK